MLKQRFLMVSILSIVFLFLSEFTDSSVFAFDAPVYPEQEEINFGPQSSRTRTVTERVLYGSRATIPASRSYNKLGWVGTLYRTSIANVRHSDGSISFLVTYRGTVSCSGTCALPTSILIDK